MGDPHARTLTLLFTDVEGSTRALQQVGDVHYAELLDVHLRLLREAFSAHGGQDMHTEGDALFFAFGSASDAVRAAVAGQRALLSHDWPAGAELPTRIGLHTGEVLPVGEYFRGLAVHQAARVCAAAHGNQILVSSTTTALAQPAIRDVTFTDLGTFRMKDLADPLQLFQVAADGLPASFPRPRTLDVAAHGVPAQPGPMVGRQQEAADVKALVLSPDIRLVTLTGPGGMGKTRMAAHIAVEVADRFIDGAWFVDLAPLRDSAHVETSIARALGIEDEPVLESLRSRKLLLVLDNFEQVLDACSLVGDIIDTARDVTVLVTSRTLLHLRGEREYVLPPMSGDANALFVHYATSVDPTFEVTPESSVTIDELCDKLDGLPLAIELAASRSKVLSPDALIDRISTSLDVLSSDRRDAPKRQRTMRDTLRWSYDLLSPEERRVFRALSVFRGSCSIEGAEAVCGADSLRTISSLVDHSLVRRSVLEDGTVRIGLLGTVHEFAAEELELEGEGAPTRLAHARYHAAWAARAEEALQGPQQATWLSALERDIDDLRAVLDWSRSPEGDGQLGLALLGDLDRFWQIRSHGAEILPALQDLLSRHPEPTRARASALVLYSMCIAPGINWDLTPAEDARKAHPYLAEASQIARGLGDDLLIAVTAFFEFKTRSSRPRSERRVSRDEVRDAVERAQRAGREDYASALQTFTDRGWGLKGFVSSLRQISGTYRFDERMRDASKKGDVAQLATLQIRRAGSFPVYDEEKWRYANEGLKAARELGDKQQEAEALLAVGKLAMSGCNYERAQEALLGSLQLYTEVNEPSKRTDVHAALAQLASAVGDRAAGLAYDRLSDSRDDPNRPYRLGAALSRVFGSPWHISLVTVLAALVWAIVPLFGPIGVFAGVALLVAGWFLSAHIRTLLVRHSRRSRTSGMLVLFPFTGLTLITFLIAYAVGRPAVGALLMLIVAVARCGRPKATLGNAARTAATAVGCVAIVLALVGSVVSRPSSDLATGLASDLAIGLALVASTTAFIVMFGWGARPARPAEHLGQMGWFAIRFFLPIGAVSALAAIHHVPFGTWGSWAQVVLPAAIIVVGISLVWQNLREIVGATALIVAGALLLATALGSSGLFQPGCVVLAAGMVVLSSRHVLLPDPPLLKIPIVA